MKEIYPVPAEFKKTARTTDTEYFERYQQSIEQPDQFWAEQAAPGLDQAFYPS